MPKKRIDRTIDMAKGLVIFTEVASGETVTADIASLCGGEKVYAALPEMAKRLMLHGGNGKFGDSAADPNVSAIPQIKSTIDQVLAGTWNAKGTGGSGPKVSLFALAAHAVATIRAKVKGKEAPTLDQLVDIIDQMTPARRKEVEASAEIKTAITKIKADRAVAKAKAAAEASKGADTELDELLG